jgi:acetylornithine deacetylase/succinyl-diaminopimelate desuccinylase-like protein
MNACDEIVHLTQDLIRIPSMHSRPQEIMRCADFIIEWCGRQGIAARKIVHAGTPSVLAMPAAQARLLLMTHFDVVDAPEELFSPRIEGDRLCGRGAIDDKYAVALSLILFRDRLRRLERTGRTQADMALGLLITGDEETGGENGAAKALREIDAEYALALDGGGPDRIVTREKGVIDITLTATGAAAHGARRGSAATPSTCSWRTTRACATCSGTTVPRTTGDAPSTSGKSGPGNPSTRSRTSPRAGSTSGTRKTTTRRAWPMPLPHGSKAGSRFSRSSRSSPRRRHP